MSNSHSLFFRMTLTAIITLCFTVLCYGENQMSSEQGKIGSGSSGGGSLMSTSIEIDLEKAVNNARTLKHDLLSVENLVLTLLDEKSVIETFDNQSIDIDMIGDELNSFISVNVSSSNNDSDPQPSPLLRRNLMQRSFSMKAA